MDDSQIREWAEKAAKDGPGHDLPCWPIDSLRAAPSLSRDEFEKIALEIESEMGMGGLSSSMYSDFAFECYKRALEHPPQPLKEPTKPA